MSDWKHITDETPKINDNVVGTLKYGGQVIGYWDGNYVVADSGKMLPIVAWVGLPNPPQADHSFLLEIEGLKVESSKTGILQVNDVRLNRRGLYTSVIRKLCEHIIRITT